MANTVGQGRQPLVHEIQKMDGDVAARLVVSQVKVVTADYTATIEDDLIVVDATAGAVTVTLPKVDLAYRGKVYEVVKIDASGNAVTVDGAGSEQIEGAASVSLPTRYATAAVRTVNNLAWTRATPSAAAGGIAGAAIDGSNVSGANLTAWRTLLAAVLKADTQDLGPISLDLIGANAAEIRFQVGFAGTLTRIRGISSKATIATGNAVVTASIGGVNCTGGAITFAIADAAGTKKNSAITAGGAFAAGDEIRLLVSGTNDAAAFAGITLDYTRT